MAKFPRNAFIRRNSSEIQNRSDVITEPSPKWLEPSPDWEKALAQWGAAWDVHLVLFASLFLLQVLVSLSIGVRFCRKALHFHIVLYIFTLVIIIGVLRFAFFLLDPYGFEGSFPKVVNHLFIQAFNPFVCASYGFVQMMVVKITSIEIGSVKLRNQTFIFSALSACSLCSLTVHGIVGLNHELKAVLLVDSCVVVAWMMFMCVTFICSGFRMSQYAQEAREARKEFLCRQKRKSSMPANMPARGCCLCWTGTWRCLGSFLRLGCLGNYGNANMCSYLQRLRSCCQGNCKGVCTSWQGDGNKESPANRPCRVNQSEEQKLNKATWKTASSEVFFRVTFSSRKTKAVNNDAETKKLFPTCVSNIRTFQKQKYSSTRGSDSDGIEEESSLSLTTRKKIEKLRSARDSKEHAQSYSPIKADKIDRISVISGHSQVCSLRKLEKLSASEESVTADSDRSLKSNSDSSFSCLISPQQNIRQKVVHRVIMPPQHRLHLGSLTGETSTVQYLSDETHAAQECTHSQRKRTNNSDKKQRKMADGRNAADRKWTFRKYYSNKDHLRPMSRQSSENDSVHIGRYSSSNHCELVVTEEKSHVQNVRGCEKFSARKSTSEEVDTRVKTHVNTSERFCPNWLKLGLNRSRFQSCFQKLSLSERNSFCHQPNITVKRENCRVYHLQNTSDVTDFCKQHNTTRSSRKVSKMCGPHIKRKILSRRQSSESEMSVKPGPSRMKPNPTRFCSGKFPDCKAMSLESFKENTSNHHSIVLGFICCKGQSSDQETSSPDADSFSSDDDGYMADNEHPQSPFLTSRLLHLRNQEAGVLPRQLQVEQLMQKVVSSFSENQRGRYSDGFSEGVDHERLKVDLTHSETTFTLLPEDELLDGHHPGINSMPSVPYNNSSPFFSVNSFRDKTDRSDDSENGLGPFVTSQNELALKQSRLQWTQTDTSSGESLAEYFPKESFDFYNNLDDIQTSAFQAHVRGHAQNSTSSDLFLIRRAGMLGSVVQGMYVLTFVHMFLCLLELYKAFGRYGVLWSETKEDTGSAVKGVASLSAWPWLTFQSLCRLTEVVSGYVTLGILSVILRYRNRRRK